MVDNQCSVVVFSQIAKQYPGLMMKLLVRAEKNPTITFQPKNATVEAAATVTAYAIQPNGTLSPLFVLNLVRLSANEIKSHCLVGKKFLNTSDIVLVGEQCKCRRVCQRTDCRRTSHSQPVSFSEMLI